MELSNKYGPACQKVASNILNDLRDIEECVNDAYLGAWNTIPPQIPNPLRSYICRIVLNLAINRYHANTASKRNSIYDVSLEDIAVLMGVSKNHVSVRLSRTRAKLISYLKEPKPEEPRALVTLEAMNRKYRDYDADRTSLGFFWESTWPIEYLSPSECCDFLTFGKNYYTIYGYAETVVIGELLGEGECKLFDGELRGHDNLLGTGMFDVYEIKGVSWESMVVVDVEGELCLFRNKYSPPETLGEWMNIYNLPNSVELKYFAEYDEHKKSYFALDDDGYIWEILSDCKEVKWEKCERKIENSIEFSINKWHLGIAHEKFEITESGYLCTNLFLKNTAFFIGEEIAGNIISYAKEHVIFFVSKTFL